MRCILNASRRQNDVVSSIRLGRQNQLRVGESVASVFVFIRLIKESMRIRVRIVRWDEERSDSGCWLADIWVRVQLLNLGGKQASQTCWIEAGVLDGSL